MATQAGEVVAGGASGVIEQLQRLIERFGLIAAGLVALAGSIASFWADTQPELRWAIIALAAAALAFIVVGKAVMPAIQARRRRKVIAIPDASLRGPTTFRLRPYDQADHDGFDRPDGAHAEALRWLQQAEKSFLYLTGFSGTGKSSLLHAWLLPELARADPPTLTLVVRSYADPGAQLTEALVKEGVIADEGALAAADPHALLERAAATVHPKRLLIAIDQFEEALILQDDAGRERLAALFRSLAARPIPGLAVLLVLRTDYLDVDQLRALGLPEVRSDANWFNLNALSRGDARELLDQRLRLDESEREKVLDEASEVDDLPGLIRPITLNMLGLILQRARGGALAGAAPGRLIQDYLRQAMSRPGIDALAPPLLAAMITEQGTKRPVDEATLAAATGNPPGFVRKALLLLGQDGLVRELDAERRVWEVSHDFVARQLGQIIPRLRPPLFRRLQTKLAPAALLAWLALLPLLAFAGPEIMERMALNALSYEGVRTPWSEELNGHLVDFGGANPGAFGRLHGWLRWVRPIRAVQIAHDPEFTDLKPLYHVIELKELTQLGIDNNAALPTIEGLAGLGALTQLDISSNDALQTIEGLAGLGALTQLHISYNDALLTIEGLAGLGALTQLTISNNAALPTIEGLAGLGALTQLTISNNAALPTIEGLAGLGALTQLTISQNRALQTIEGLAGLGALTQLDISGNYALQTIERLAGLGALTQLTISQNLALQTIEGLAGLGALTQLTIFDNAALQTIEGLAGLGALTQLTISNNAALQTIEGLAGLGALTQLTISGNYALQTIEGLAGLGALTQLDVSDNDALQTIEGLAGLGALTQLTIVGNALQTIEGLSDLESVEELRLQEASCQRL